MEKEYVISNNQSFIVEDYSFNKQIAFLSVRKKGIPDGFCCYFNVKLKNVLDCILHHKNNKVFGEK